MESPDLKGFSAGFPPLLESPARESLLRLCPDCRLCGRVKKITLENIFIFSCFAIVKSF